MDSKLTFSNSNHVEIADSNQTVRMEPRVRGCDGAIFSRYLKKQCVRYTRLHIIVSVFIFGGNFSLALYHRETKATNMFEWQELPYSSLRYTTRKSII